MEIENVSGQIIELPDNQKWECVDCALIADPIENGDDTEYYRCLNCSCYEFYPEDIEGDDEVNIFNFIALPK